MRRPSTVRFDAADVPPLLEKAKAGDIEARDKLLFMFQRLVSTLVHVCITGRVNYRSSYQRTFLKYFTLPDTPLENTAAMLKKRLASVDKKELFTLGQIAVLEAIRDCKTNLSSTIVICFKEHISALIKDFVPTERSFPEGFGAAPDMEDTVLVQLFKDGLDEMELGLLETLLTGGTPTKSELAHMDSLRQKASEYFDDPAEMLSSGL